MNLLRLNFLKKQSNLFYFVIISSLFLFFIYLNNGSLLQKFDPNTVSRYLRSQDILDTDEKIKDRIFVSDSEIYIASGYLYADGQDPRAFNFQHPPFVKYLFGFSSKYFNLPLLPNMIFAALLIFEVFVLGKLSFRNELVGLLSSIMLMFDPVFKEVTTYALLDLGQMVFLLGFLIFTFFYKKHFIGQGILLGLALASKFYSPVIIFVGVAYLCKILIKDINVKRTFLTLLIAFITFCLTYSISFKNENGLFNLLFHQAKIIKFMIEHNKAIEWGGTLKMFFGGYFAWPLLFFVNLYQMFKFKNKDSVLVFSLLPCVYLLIMTFQIPFTRYFILILPFLYLIFANTVYKSLL